MKNFTRVVTVALLLVSGRALAQQAASGGAVAPTPNSVTASHCLQPGTYYQGPEGSGLLLAFHITSVDPDCRIHGNFSYGPGTTPAGGGLQTVNFNSHLGTDGLAELGHCYTTSLCYTHLQPFEGGMRGEICDYKVHPNGYPVGCYPIVLRRVSG
jgi:hypothetical protein